MQNTEKEVLDRLREQVRDYGPERMARTTGIDRSILTQLASRMGNAEVRCGISPWFLPCANGSIDLRTGTFHTNGCSGDQPTSKTNFQGISAPAKNWEQALLDIFGGDQDLVEFMRRALGCALIGMHLENAFFVLCGSGQNGKSLLTETVWWVLGDLIGHVPNELLGDQGPCGSMGPNRDVLALKDKRVAMATQGQRLDPALVKWLTSGDVLSGRYPFDKYPTLFEPTHTLFLMTNSPPNVSAEDTAFWERVYLIPFEVLFVDLEPRREDEKRRDKLLKSKLKEEASGILAWLVIGCLEYQKQGLNPPNAVRAATEECWEDNDVLSNFLDARCIRAANMEVEAGTLYREFEDWFQSQVGKRPWTQSTLHRAMGKRFTRVKEGSGSHYYRGVGLPRFC